MKSYNIIIILLILFGLFFVFESSRVRHLKQEKDLQKQKEVEELKNNILSLREDTESLRGELKEYEEKLYGVGGAASYPQDLNDLNDGEFFFPIAQQDFLRYTSPFGYREDPFFKVKMHHRGVDIATIWNAQVVSAADGVVVEHWPPPGSTQNGIEYSGHRVYGGMIKIEHDGFETLYAHLSSTNVATGDIIRAGENIGRVGDTGMSRGHHLHFEMFINEENVNPLLYLSELNYEG